jgi:two-component system, response regulator YesN
VDRIRRSKITPYRWEVCTRLANAVRAGDVEAAEERLRDVMALIAETRVEESVDEVKLRMVQVLGIVNRAAYSAGANHHRVFQVNITTIDRLIPTKTIPEITEVARKAIQTMIALVPDKDYFAKAKIDLALQYIQEHCTQNISRKAVAKLAACSPSHLSHIFSQLTGHTFTEYVLKQRMEKAKELLRKTSPRISDVAYEVGYDDPNYFSYAFKKVVGVSPFQYRKRIAPSEG